MKNVATKFSTVREKIKENIREWRSHRSANKLAIPILVLLKQQDSVGEGENTQKTNTEMIRRLRYAYSIESGVRGFIYSNYQ